MNAFSFSILFSLFLLGFVIVLCSLSVGLPLYFKVIIYAVLFLHRSEVRKCNQNNVGSFMLHLASLCTGYRAMGRTQTKQKMNLADDGGEKNNTIMTCVRLFRIHAWFLNNDLFVWHCLLEFCVSILVPPVKYKRVTMKVTDTDMCKCFHWTTEVIYFCIFKNVNSCNCLPKRKKEKKQEESYSCVSDKDGNRAGRWNLNEGRGESCRAKWKWWKCMFSPNICI